MVQFPIILKLLNDNPGLEEEILSLAKTSYYYAEQARIYFDLRKRWPQLAAVVLWCSPSIVFDTIDIIIFFKDGANIKRIVEWDKEAAGFGGGFSLDLIAEDMCQTLSLELSLKEKKDKEEDKNVTITD